MKDFKELNIVTEENGFIGKKIEMYKVLNCKIVVHKFKIEASKFDKGKGNGKCLYLQIGIDNVMHVVFTGSVKLQNVVTQLKEEDFPFTTTIVKENDSFKFT